MTAKGMQLCRRNSWRHFANLDQKTCIQMCVCVYINILIYIYNMYINYIRNPNQGLTLVFCVAFMACQPDSLQYSWHHRQ